jgi:ribosomal protein L37AE/L43A
MKRGATTITWTCPKCEAETEVTVYPVIPAQTYGPPENCYPEEGGEIEPEECEKCGAEIDNGAAHAQAGDKIRIDQEDRYAE